MPDTPRQPQVVNRDACCLQVWRDFQFKVNPRNPQTSHPPISRPNATSMVLRTSSPSSVPRTLSSFANGRGFETGMDEGQTGRQRLTQKHSEPIVPPLQGR